MVGSTGSWLRRATVEASSMVAMVEHGWCGGGAIDGDNGGYVLPWEP